MPTRDASQGVASQAQQQGVTIDVTFTDGSVRVTVGPDRLLQALDNLLSNAVKFITEGGLVRFKGRSRTCAWRADRGGERSGSRFHLHDS